MLKIAATPQLLSQNSHFAGSFGCYCPSLVASYLRDWVDLQSALVLTMSKTQLDTSQCPEVGEKPHQPWNITFPKLPFGKTKVAYCPFQASWFDWWSWLHWDVVTERAFCHVCVLAFKQKKLNAANADAAFITRGFQNWKDATGTFRGHELSSCHKKAVEKVITLAATTRDVGESLSSIVAEQKRVNRDCFLKVLSSIQYLAPQGLAIRGDGTGEIDGNFSQLMKLRSEDDPLLLDWFKKKTDKYTGHDMQNEAL